MASTTNNDFFNTKVLGHPAGLFVMFFTEMWERFSFYGMRVLLLQFLTAPLIKGSAMSGWGWTPEQAGALYGTYVMMLYLTPIFGGLIADRYIGARMAVIVGAIIMTIGHAAMAIETHITFFIGLACLVIGTGFFKPNMPSILGQMYKDLPQKKDGAYTIFYMGVNSGAFFGMMLCGYLAETQGWHWGFGLAGIFMALGTIQFALAKPLMGNLGVLDKKQIHSEHEPKPELTEKRNPFTMVDYILVGIVSVLGLVYAFNDPLSKNNIVDMFAWLDVMDKGSVLLRGQTIAIIVTLVLFIYLLVSRIVRYERVVRDRMFTVMLLAFFLVFFFMSFEQGASSLVLVARDNIDRTLKGEGLLIFNIVNGLLTVVPLLIISYVLVKLAKATWFKIATSNMILLLCFLLIWVVVGWMLYNEFSKETSEITVSWFSILNSFFVITLASFVSKIWNSKYNPSAAFKYGYGLILVSIGFLALFVGAVTMGEDAKIPMFFLVFTYLLHTLGELFISPVGLSYVSKLVPVRMLAFMFGIWYLAIAIAQKAAAALGGQVKSLQIGFLNQWIKDLTGKTELSSLVDFFFLFTIIPLVAGVLVILINPIIKKLMHDIR